MSRLAISRPQCADCDPTSSLLPPRDDQHHLRILAGAPSIHVPCVHQQHPSSGQPSPVDATPQTSDHTQHPSLQECNHDRAQRSKLQLQRRLYAIDWRMLSAAWQTQPLASLHGAARARRLCSQIYNCAVRRACVRDKNDSSSGTSSTATPSPRSSSSHPPSAIGTSCFERCAASAETNGHASAEG